MDKVLELMSKRKWQKHCLRANVAQPDDIVTYGTVKVAKIYSNVLNNRDKEPELYDAIKGVAPEWWGDDTQITLNKDLVCKETQRPCEQGALLDPVVGGLHRRSTELRRWCQDRRQGGLAQDQRTHSPLERPPRGKQVLDRLYRRTRTTKSNRLADASRAKRAAAAAAANQTAPQSEAQAPCTDPSSETSA